MTANSGIHFTISTRVLSLGKIIGTIFYLNQMSYNRSELFLYNIFVRTYPYIAQLLYWIGLCSVLRPRQHSIVIWETVFTGQKTQPTVSNY